MWFLDIGYLIALFSEKATFHAQALAMHTRAQRERVRLFSTDAVVLEVGAAFSRIAMRGVGASIIQTLIADDGIEIVPVTEPPRSKALALFTRH